jgi:hypothetical protein
LAKEKKRGQSCCQRVYGENSWTFACVLAMMIEYFGHDSMAATFIRPRPYASCAPLPFGPESEGKYLPTGCGTRMRLIASIEGRQFTWYKLLGHASVATTGRYLHDRPTESSGKYLAE